MVNPTISFLRQDGDALECVELADGLLSAALSMYEPEEAYVVRLDNWFDSKWRGFAGKVLGAVPVWKHRLVLPPFHPNRVRSQVKYRRENGGWEADETGRALHRIQRSQEGLSRFVDQTVESGLLAWLSGGSEVTGQASLMIYAGKATDWDSWYVSFQRRTDSWVISKADGMSRSELELLLAREPRCKQDVEGK